MALSIIIQDMNWIVLVFPLLGVVTAAVAGATGSIASSVIGAKGASDSADAAKYGSLSGTSPISTFLSKYVLGMNQDRYGRWAPNKFFNKGTSAINKQNYTDIIAEIKKTMFNPQKPNEFELEAQRVARMSLDRIPRTMEVFDTAVNTAEEAARTGLLTDIAPLKDQAIRRLNREILPGLRERNASQRFSSDAAMAETNAARDVATDLGALGAQLQESANQRRLAALGIAPTIAMSSATLPMNLSSDLLGQASTMRQLDNMSDPGKHMLAMLQGMQGTFSDQSYVMGGNNPAGSSTANMIEAISGAAQGIGSALGKIDFSGWGRSNNTYVGDVPQNTVYDIA
jgi:hypothetical protein